MLLREHFSELAAWKIEITGTDLSPAVVARAKTGRYSQIEVNRGLPASYLLKYFTKETDTWLLKPEIRGMVSFRQMNLMQPWPCQPPFDIVFLRNVMIYFDVETKRSILKRLRGCLQPNGFLILGASETTINVDPGYKALVQDRTTLFQLA